MTEPKPTPITTFDEYQTEARKTAQYPIIGHDIIYPTLGLTGEAGEVSDKVKKLFRDRNGELNEPYRRDIAKELGDVIWYLSALADGIGYTMGEIAAMNIKSWPTGSNAGSSGVKETNDDA